MPVSQEMKDYGRRLLLALDKTPDKPTAMLWSNALGQGWVLMIATLGARVDDAALREPIGQRVEALMKSLNPGQPVPQFGITAPANNFLETLAMIVTTPPDAVAQIELAQNFVNGANTGDNYVYRLNIQ